MAKIHIEMESLYDKGDFVVFVQGDAMLVGVIVGYYVDHGAGRSIWYNIQINQNTVLTYNNGGDVMESDILGKLGDSSTQDVVQHYIQHGLD